MIVHTVNVTNIFVEKICPFVFKTVQCLHDLQLIQNKVKFMFSEKATKIEEIFTVNLTLCSKCQIEGEDFVNFCGLLKKHELYI